jgi:hypothetical protein
VALFEKAAHSDNFYDLQIELAIYYPKTKQFCVWLILIVTENRLKNNFKLNPSTTMGQKF